MASTAAGFPKAVMMDMEQKPVYCILKTLGRGAFGTVYLGTDDADGKTYAIKRVRRKNLKHEDLIRIEREIIILKTLQHPQIVSIHKVYQTPAHLTIVMDYVSQGDLFDYLDCNKPLKYHVVQKLFGQIASATYFCHLNGIVHRDLKLENIFLGADDRIKVGDFGFANFIPSAHSTSDDCPADDFMQNSSLMTTSDCSVDCARSSSPCISTNMQQRKFLKTACGSPLYSSPEIISGKPYLGPEVDVWALGVILYCLKFGFMPFGADDQSMVKLKEQIVSGSYWMPQDRNGMQENTKSARVSNCMHPFLIYTEITRLIQQLLVVDAACRATTKQVCENSWLNSIPLNNNFDDTDALLQPDATTLEQQTVYMYNEFKHSPAAELLRQRARLFCMSENAADVTSGMALHDMVAYRDRSPIRRQVVEVDFLGERGGGAHQQKQQQPSSWRASVAAASMMNNKRLPVFQLPQTTKSSSAFRRVTAVPLSPRGAISSLNSKANQSLLESPLLWQNHHHHQTTSSSTPPKCVTGRFCVSPTALENMPAVVACSSSNGRGAAAAAAFEYSVERKTVDNQREADPPPECANIDVYFDQEEQEEHQRHGGGDDAEFSAHAAVAEPKSSSDLNADEFHLPAALNADRHESSSSNLVDRQSDSTERRQIDAVNVAESSPCSLTQKLISSAKCSTTAKCASADVLLVERQSPNESGRLAEHTQRDDVKGSSSTPSVYSGQQRRNTFPNQIEQQQQQHAVLVVDGSRPPFSLAAAADRPPPPLRRRSSGSGGGILRWSSSASHHHNQRGAGAGGGGGGGAHRRLVSSSESDAVERDGGGDDESAVVRSGSNSSRSIKGILKVGSSSRLASPVVSADNFIPVGDAVTSSSSPLAVNQLQQNDRPIDNDELTRLVALARPEAVDDDDSAAAAADSASTSPLKKPTRGILKKRSKSVGSTTSSSSLSRQLVQARICDANENSRSVASASAICQSANVRSSFSGHDNNNNNDEFANEPDVKFYYDVDNEENDNANDDDDDEDELEENECYSGANSPPLRGILKGRSRSQSSDSGKVLKSILKKDGGSSGRLSSSTSRSMSPVTFASHSSSLANLQQQQQNFGDENASNSSSSDEDDADDPDDDDDEEAEGDVRFGGAGIEGSLAERLLQWSPRNSVSPPAFQRQNSHDDYDIVNNNNNVDDADNLMLNDENAASQQAQQQDADFSPNLNASADAVITDTSLSSRQSFVADGTQQRPLKSILKKNDATDITNSTGQQQAVDHACHSRHTSFSHSLSGNKTTAMNRKFSNDVTTTSFSNAAPATMYRRVSSTTLPSSTSSTTLTGRMSAGAGAELNIVDGGDNGTTNTMHDYRYRARSRSFDLSSNNNKVVTTKLPNFLLCKTPAQNSTSVAFTPNDKFIDNGLVDYPVPETTSVIMPIANSEVKDDVEVNWMIDLMDRKQAGQFSAATSSNNVSFEHSSHDAETRSSFNSVACPHPPSVSVRLEPGNDDAGFDYTSARHDTDVGEQEVTKQQHESVAVNAVDAAAEDASDLLTRTSLRDSIILTKERKDSFAADNDNNTNYLDRSSSTSTPQFLQFGDRTRSLTSSGFHSSLGGRHTSQALRPGENLQQTLLRIAEQAIARRPKDAVARSNEPKAV